MSINIFAYLDGFKSKDNIPINCSKCGMLLERNKRSIQKNLRKNRGKFVCLSCAMSAKSQELSSRSVALWKNESYRNKNKKAVSESVKKRVDQISNNMKKVWKDPKYRAKYEGREISQKQKQQISNSLKTHWEDPAHRLAQSVRTKDLYKNPNYIINKSRGQSKAMTEELRQKHSDNTKNLWKQGWYRNKLAAQMAERAPQSVLEDIVASILDDYCIKYVRQAVEGPWSFDFKVGDLYFEIQGSYWHDNKEAKIRDKQKHTYFEKHVSGTLVYIYEHEFYSTGKLGDKIFSLCGGTLKKKNYDFDFKEVSVKICDVSESKKFLDKYHYLSKNRGGLHIAAYYKEAIIAVAVVSPVTRIQTAHRLKLTHKQVLELSRFCIKTGYNKKNFASWMLSRVVKTIKTKMSDVKCVVSFADPSLSHDGGIYISAGWKLDGYAKPTYFYIDSDGKLYHKKSVWDQAKRLCMTESNYAFKFGLKRICGNGKLKRFIKRL